MNFDYTGYNLKFIQRNPCKDGSSHLYSYIFKFHSPITNHIYILIAEYYNKNVFSIKFYSKRHRKSQHKYNKIINKGDVGNILISCLNVIPYLLNIHPTSSFAISSSRTIDFKHKRVENSENNQRFKLYKYIIQKKIGTETFSHFEYTKISSYMLINNKNDNIEQKERELVSMFSHTYMELSNII